jgi:tRNA(fMet)-specific endonuclease VapC
MRKIILDTNAYGKLLGGDEALLDVVGDAEVVYMSIFVLAELYAGFRGGTREEENRRRLRDFLGKSPVHILPADNQTAEVFGELYHRLKTVGKPIPINDLWIAAQAVEQGAFVVSYDDHFTAVPGLLLWPARQ